MCWKGWEVGCLVRVENRSRQMSAVVNFFIIFEAWRLNEDMKILQSKSLSDGKQKW